MESGLVLGCIVTTQASDEHRPFKMQPAMMTSQVWLLVASEEVPQRAAVCVEGLAA